MTNPTLLAIYFSLITEITAKLLLSVYLSLFTEISAKLSKDNKL